MPRYRIDLPPGARKDLRGIRDRRLHGRIIEAISALADAPARRGA